MSTDDEMVSDSAAYIYKTVSLTRTELDYDKFESWL